MGDAASAKQRIGLRLVPLLALFVLLFVFLVPGWTPRKFWTAWLPDPKFVDDGTVAIALALILLVLVVCTVITILTESTSNTATTEMVLPFLAAPVGAIHMDPLQLIIPATLPAGRSRSRRAFAFANCVIVERIGSLLPCATGLRARWERDP